MTSSGETQPVAAARYWTPDAGPTSGLGPRVEKILFVAEQEAAETRRSATRESTAMIERARDEAEALRHEGEQAVLAFRDEVERYAEDRAADLDDREHRLERERENSRVDGELLLADARREADRILAEAASLAEEVRVEVEVELQERRAEVERQMGWLEESRRAARALAHMLLEQVGDTVPEKVTATESASPAESDAPAEPAAPAVSTELVATAEPTGSHPVTDVGGREATASVEDTVAVPQEPVEAAADERTTAVPPVWAGVAEVGERLEPRHRRYSPRAAPPPELRLAGVLGGMPSLAAVEPLAVVEPEAEALVAPAPPAAPTAVPAPAAVPAPTAPDRAPRERDDRDWFTVGDSTERLRAVPGYRSSSRGRTA